MVKSASYWKIKKEQERREKIKKLLELILAGIIFILFMAWGGFTFPY